MAYRYFLIPCLAELLQPVAFSMTKEEGYWGNLWYIPAINVVEMREIEDIKKDPSGEGPRGYTTEANN